MPLNPKHFYLFGPFQLERAERRLSRAGRQINLPPKEFDLLLALVEARGRLCTVENLRNKVWPDSPFMEDQNVSVHISQIRKALGDGGNGGQKYIQTVRGQGGGYRLLVDATEHLEEERPHKRLRSIWVIGVCVVAASAVVLLQRALHREKPSEGQKFYSLALEYEQQGDDDQALAALDRAISLDSQLADAYLEAACIHHELDEEDSAGEYLQKAKALANTRDQAFRLRVEGLDLDLSGYQSQALQDYQLLVDRFPKDIAANYRLADLALDMGRLDDAGRALAACITAEPNNPYCSLDAMVLSLLRNDFDGVVRTYQDLSVRGLRYPWFHAPVGVALLGKNDLAGAAREFRALEGVKARFHGTAHFRVAKERLADLDLYTGRLAAARAQLKEALETAYSSEERADDLIFQARIETLVGNIKAARSAAIEATQVSDSELVYVSAARVLASIGDAKVLNYVLSGHMPNGADLGDIGPANLNFIKGVFSLQRGRFDEAARMLGSSYEEEDDPFTAFLLAQAHQKARRWDRAAELYERVLADKGDVLWNDIPALLPLAQYHVAGCYREMGEIKEARESYSQFLVLWSGADQEIGEVRAAKQALAALPK